MNDTMCHPYNNRSGLSWFLHYPHRTDMEDHISMVQMIQLTRGQEETLNRITTALEQIAENTKPKTADTDAEVSNDIRGGNLTAWAHYPVDKVPEKAIQYMLDLIDRINYAYLQTDGKYGDLAYVVSDKVKLIEKTLRESKRDKEGKQWHKKYM